MNWTESGARSYPRRGPTLGPLAPRGRPGWMDEAACKNQPGAFFPGEGENDLMVIAKRTCAGCPVIDDCLAYALLHREKDGVWGGTSANERETILRKRRAS